MYSRTAIASLWVLLAASAVGWAVPMPRIQLPDLTAVAPGATVELPIVIRNYPLDMGGIDLTVAYDSAAMTITDVVFGQLLTGCKWEFLGHQTIDSSGCAPSCSRLLRLMAIAETVNGPYHPSCFGPPDSAVYELFRLQIQVSGDPSVYGTYQPIRFFWRDCTSNGVSTPAGDFLCVDAKIYDHLGNLLWDEADDQTYPEESRPPGVGSPDSCGAAKRLLICGDANGDGATNVGDAVSIVNYIFKTGPAPSPLEMGDANGDKACNVGDAIYIVNFVFKSGPAPVCDGLVRFIEYQHGGIYITTP